MGFMYKCVSRLATFNSDIRERIPQDGAPPSRPALGRTIISSSIPSKACDEEFEGSLRDKPEHLQQIVLALAQICLFVCQVLISNLEAFGFAQSSAEHLPAALFLVIKPDKENYGGLAWDQVDCIQHVFDF